MSRNEVRVRANVDDKATKPITDIRNAFKTLQNEGAKGVAAGISAAATIQAWNLAAGAIRGVADAVGDSVRGAIEEEASLKRLNLAIGENDKAWDGNIDRVNDVIEARQELGFADDEQRDSLAFLVSVTQDHNKALALQRTAMDLARLKGMDLRTAGELLGKVYAGNVSILSRYGIKLAEGTSATAALAEIQRRAKGQAEAYGDTTAGAMDAAGIAVDNLKEDFGKLLLPVIKEGAQFLTKTAIPAVKDFAGVIGEAGKAAGDAVKPVDDFFRSVAGQDFFGTLDDLGDALTAFARHGTDLDAVFNEAFREDIAEAFTPSGNRLRELYRASGEAASREFAMGLDPTPLEDSFADMFATVEAQGRSFGGSWGALGRDLPRIYADGIVEARQKPLDALAELKELMKHSLSETAETTRLLGQLASEELAKGLIDKDPAVRNAAAGARNAIINRLADLEVTPGTLTRKGMDALIEAMESADPIVARAAEDIYDSVRHNLPSAADMFKWGKAALASYADAFYAMAPELEQAALASMHGVRGVFEAHSPPGPKSPLHEIDVWGERTGAAWVDGFTRGLRPASWLGAMSSFTPPAAVPRPTLSPPVGMDSGEWIGALLGDANDPMPGAVPRRSDFGADVGADSRGGGDVTVNVYVTNEAGIIDPYGDLAQRIADALLPAMRRAVDRTGVSLAPGA